MKLNIVFIRKTNCLYFCKYNDLPTAALDSVFGTESSAAVVEPRIFHNRALFSKFYMPVHECRAHSFLFLYHELQF